MDLYDHSRVHLHSNLAAFTVKDFTLAPLAQVISQYLGVKQRRGPNVFDMILFIAKDGEKLLKSAKFLALKFKLLLESTPIYSLNCSVLSGSFTLLTYNRNLVSASAFSFTSAVRETALYYL